MMRISRLPIFLVLFLLPACRDSAVSSLASASACMQAHPDSALSILRSIPADGIRTLGGKAKYSLLLAQALDKNHIDTTDIRVLDPAVSYYFRYGTKDERAAVWYYLGRIQLHTGDMEDARNSFSTALDYSEGSRDNLLLMRLYAQVSALYSADNNLEEAQRYIRMAREAVDRSDDNLNKWLLQAREATSLSNLERYGEADSLFADFFSQPVLDSTIRARFLLNYAKTLLHKTPPEPLESIRAYEEAVSSGCMPNVDNACVYALACEYTGRSKDADTMLQALDNANPAGRNLGILHLCKYRIYKHRGDTERALRHYEMAVATSDSIVRQTLGQSLERSRQDYLAGKAEALDLQRKNAIIASALVLILLAAALSVVLFLRRATVRAKEEEIESLKEETSRLLALDKGKEDTIARLREGYVSMYKGQFKLLDNLCATYWSPSRTDTKEIIYSQVREALNVISSDVHGQRELEAMIDRDLDGIMTKLRADLPGRTDEDFRFIAYLIIGLSPKTIASILDCVPGSVYNRKMRLKERLSRLDSPYRELYLDYII